MAQTPPPGPLESNGEVTAAVGERRRKQNKHPGNEKIHQIVVSAGGD